MVYIIKQIYLMKVLILISVFLICGKFFAQTEQKTTYTYDKLNRLEKVLYTNGYQTTYTYDKLGNRESAQTIDLYGTLPDREIIVDAIGTSCIGKENGMITLFARDENTEHEYHFTINRYVNGQPEGPPIASSILGAANSWQLQNRDLTVGDYIVTTSIVGVSTDIYSKDYIVRVGEPTPLLVSVTQFNNTVTLEMVGGTPPFSIGINNSEVMATLERNVELPIQPNDVVSVQSKRLCEGTFEKKIIGNNKTTVYPNPVKDLATVVLDNSINDGLFVLVKIYDSAGNTITSNNPKVENNSVSVSMKTMSSGVYYIHIPAINESFKIIKE